MKNEIIAWALLFLGVVIVWLVYRAVEIYERIKKSIEELKKEIECHENRIEYRRRDRHEAIEKVDPVVKENSTTDREYLRRELSEKIMVAMIRELAGKSPHSTSNNITVFEAMAADAVSYADALIEELDKKK